MSCGVFSKGRTRGKKYTIQLFVCQITITVLIIFLKIKNWGKNKDYNNKKHKPQSKTMRGKMSKQTYHECFPS